MSSKTKGPKIGQPKSQKKLLNQKEKYAIVNRKNVNAQQITC